MARAIMPYLEERYLGAQWKPGRCFYDQTQAMRETIVTSYLCPNRGNGRALVKITSDGQHSHSGEPFLGAYTDYAATSSTFLPGTGYHQAEFNGALIYGNFNEFPDVPLVMTGWHSRTTFKSISDGTSKTFLAGEITAQLSASVGAYNGDDNWGWRLGDDTPLYVGTDKQDGFGSDHPGVCNFGFVDGSARSMSNETSLKILEGLVTRAGREIITNL